MKRAMPHLLKVVLVGLAASCAWSGTAQAWWNNDWTIRKKITIDTSATGGAITDPIGTTPVLIRLADFDFGSAKDDGSDIRLIADDDKTPLAFHIEKYDSLLGEAFVWVKVPDLKPGAQTTLWLYYGNQGNITVPGGGDAERDLRFRHGAGLSLCRERRARSRFVGPGQRFARADRDDRFAHRPRFAPWRQAARHDSRVASLAWTDGASLTWSAWIKPAALQPNAIIFSRRDGTRIS
jgi:biopolymer transport protein ExbB